LDVDVDDVVTFPYCTVEASGIRDGLTGRLINGNPVALHVVAQCDGSRKLGRVVDAVAERFGVGSQRARLDLLTFLEAADAHGLLRIRRGIRVRVTPMALFGRLVELLVLRVRNGEQRRYPATARCCAAATLRATRLPLYLGLGIVPFLAYLLAVQPGVPASRVVIGAAAPVVVVLAVQASIWLHELGHLVALTGPDRDTAYFQSMSLQVLLVHDTALPVRRRVVALAGPGLAVLACLLSAGLLRLTSLPEAVSAVPLAVAGAHMFSLMPWAHDGRALLDGKRIGVADGASGAVHATR
jgi:hypothetical protein